MGGLVQHGAISLFCFGRRDIADGREEPTVVEPVRPFKRGIFIGVTQLSVSQAPQGFSNRTRTGKGAIVEDFARCRTFDHVSSNPQGPRHLYGVVQDEDYYRTGGAARRGSMLWARPMPFSISSILTNPLAFR